MAIVHRDDTQYNQLREQILFVKLILAVVVQSGGWRGEFTLLRLEDILEGRVSFHLRHRSRVWRILTFA